MSNRLILGTRGSDLARAQTSLVSAALQAAHPALEIEVEIIRTRGDARLDRSLAELGALDKGLFTRELEDALRAGRIDAAVHSLKDLPVESPAGLRVAAVPTREDPADVLVTRAPGGLAALPAGAVVGTGSPRRQAQLRARRPDLRLQDLRGNVPTRLQKLAEGMIDAVVLAAAGLRRLGRPVQGCEEASGLWFEALPWMLPAPGQGAIAVQTRADDRTTGVWLSALHDPGTACRVEAEREVLAAFGGGCHLALGALAELAGDELRLQAVAFHPSGQAAYGLRQGPAGEARRLAREVAGDMRHG